MADEPTGSLDSNSARILLQMMSELNKETGATILMVTHDAFCASYADRILFLKDGKIFNEILKAKRRGIYSITKSMTFSPSWEVTIHAKGIINPQCERQSKRLFALLHHTCLYGFLYVRF